MYLSCLIFTSIILCELLKSNKRKMKKEEEKEMQVSSRHAFLKVTFLLRNDSVFKVLVKTCIQS